MSTQIQLLGGEKVHKNTHHPHLPRTHPGAHRLTLPGAQDGGGGRSLSPLGATCPGLARQSGGQLEWNTRTEPQRPRPGKETPGCTKHQGDPWLYPLQCQASLRHKEREPVDALGGNNKPTWENNKYFWSIYLFFFCNLFLYFISLQILSVRLTYILYIFIYQYNASLEGSPRGLRGHSGMEAW